MSRKWRILIIVGPLAVLVLITLANVYVGTGYGHCNRCFASFHSSTIRVFGIPLHRQRKFVQRGPAALRAMQTTCPHYWQGGGRSGYLLGAKELGTGGPPSGMSIVEDMDRFGHLKCALWTFAALAEGTQQTAQDEWTRRYIASAAWAVQLVSGQDFGVTYDTAEEWPVTRSDSVDRILDWGVEEGVISRDVRERIRGVQSRPSGT